MPPKIPTRTDAYTLCDCGGTMSIQTVEPIPGEPDKMRHSYKCLECGGVSAFEVDKKKDGAG